MGGDVHYFLCMTCCMTSLATHRRPLLHWEQKQALTWQVTSQAMLLGNVVSAQAVTAVLLVRFDRVLSDLYRNSIPVCVEFIFSYLHFVISYEPSCSVWYCIKSYLISYDQHIILHVEWLKKHSTLSVQSDVPQG